MLTPKQQLDALIDLFIPDIRSAFLASVQDIVDNALLNQIINAIQSGDVEAAFRAIGFSSAAMRPLTAAIERAYETGGVMTGKTYPKYLQTPSGKAVFRFDVRNSRAEAWLRDKSSTLVSRIEDNTRVNIRNVLTVGMQDGRNPRNVALDLIGRIDPASGKRAGGIVGLTQQQEYWARGARRKLVTLDGSYFNLELRDKRFDRTVAAAIRDNKPLTGEIVDKLVMRYKDNALKFRGENIARTEAMQSLNASEYEALMQAVAMGAVTKNAVQREWDDAGDERVRHSHVLLNGQRVGLNEPFVSPATGARMMFPGDISLGAPPEEIIDCRCRARSVIDWLSDLSDDVPLKPNHKTINQQNDQKSKEYVLEHGRKTNTEYLVGHNQKTGEMLTPSKGDKSSVMIPLPLEEMMNDPTNSIVLHHNHPLSSSFSYADLVQGVKPGMVGIWAHGHDGSSFYAERGDRSFLKSDFKNLDDRVATYLQNQIYARELSVDDAISMSNHVTALALEQAGFIKYNFDLSPQKQTAMERMRSMIEQLLAELNK